MENFAENLNLGNRVRPPLLEAILEKSALTASPRVGIRTTWFQ